MNISPVSIPSNQPVLSDGQSTNLPAVENSIDGFNEMLQALSSVAPVNSAAVLPIANKSTTWPMAWLEILGQNPNTSGPALDLLEEAPNLANQSDESAISLTEIMTALQPIVTESQLAAPTPLTHDLANDATGKQANTIDETNLALLTLMSSFNPLQPVTTTPALPTPDTTTEVTTNQTVQSVPAWTPVINGDLPGQTQPTPAQPAAQATVIAELKSTEAATAPVQATTPATPSKFNQTFAQELDQQLVSNPATSEMNQKAGAAAQTSTEPVLKPKVQAAEAVPNPILAAQTSNPALQEVNSVQRSAFNVQSAETNIQLSNIPALHQIIDRLSLMTHHGQTEVRLHLHPESLGQLAIQLHIVDGDIAVRMVAETAQAQKLIQEHLPQLKAAFTAQGLQLNDMAVAVGGGASSFDLSGHQSHNNWPQQSAYPPVYSAAPDKTEPVMARPAVRTWNNGYAVDYQV